MAKKTARMPWRKKEAIMRWHSYQSLVARARRKRVGSTGRMPVLLAPNHYDYDYEQEHEAAGEEEL